MAGLDLRGLIGKLNPSCQRALEAAAGLCLSKTNYNVEIEHWLVKLLEQPGNDICLLFRHFGVDQAKVMAGLAKAIDGFKTGNARPPLLSPEVCVLIRQAWLVASVDNGEVDVRGGAAAAGTARRRIDRPAGPGGKRRAAEDRPRCAGP